MAAADFKSRWTWALDRYGLPIVLLVVVGLVGRDVGNWARPIIERGVQKHIEFVDKTAESIEVQARSSERIGSMLDELRTENKESHGQIRDIHGVVVRGHRPGVAGVAEPATN